MIRLQLFPPLAQQFSRICASIHLAWPNALQTLSSTLGALGALAIFWLASSGAASCEEIDRSPVDLAISKSGKWIVTANQTSSTVTLIDVEALSVVDEQPCGQHPADIVINEDDQTVLVSCMWSGEVSRFRINDRHLVKTASIRVGFHPCGIAIDPKANRAFVGLVATGEVAEIDLRTNRLTRRIPVGLWPRYLTLSQDNKRLAVGCSGESKIVVLDTDSGEALYDAKLANSVNLGHMITSIDGKHAYFTWMVYRTNPITAGNIRRGWVLASRIGRVRLDEPEYREAMSLDVPRKAIGDPHGISITRDEEFMIASASGTHELLVYRLKDLPMVGTGGPGDLIDRRLENDRQRFNRIPVGGRPMGMQIASDDRTVYVANFMRNSVQVVDIAAKEIVNEIALGGATEPQTLARKGMAIFYDAQKSLDQWYSCHSCHQDGGTNSRPMDTMNDGSEMTLKTVLPFLMSMKQDRGPGTAGNRASPIRCTNR